MVTIKDISEKCGVSVSTVSKVLNGYSEISTQTKDLVKAAAVELGYGKKSVSAFYKKRRTYQLGVLFSTMWNLGLKQEYFAYILSSFREEANNAGYDVTFLEHNVGRKTMTYLEHCRSRQFDGVCIACTYFLLPEVVELAQSEFPIVTIDHAYNGSIAILSDNIGGMKDLAEYVISMGHKKIAYIHGTESVVMHNRLAGFNRVMQEHGIVIPEKFYLSGEYTNPDLAEKIATQLLSLSDRPTCILAPDDISALGVFRAAAKKGLKIPDDLSVAGYDGISVSQVIVPRLTTVQQDSETIGREAAKRLIRYIESPMTTPIENCIVKSKLVKGESVIAPKGSLRAIYNNL
ncbi:MAG TPA: LacI family transcriptional regulator [Lachnospiraceae bacterium]|jgi:LacI family transcriptional regulator|nr:LacI family transcriptional regulator [Lachnospiraceae bacterium]HBZ89654.1 LacI family transcriptional regulator [Lachnospiraceae bacterium]